MSSRDDDDATVYPKPIPAVAKPKNDPVRPNYYKVGTPFELIPFLRAWGFHKDAYLFQCIVYIFRAGLKDKNDLLTDYKKAKYYLELKIAEVEKGNE